MCLLLVTVLTWPTVTIVCYFPMAHMVTAVIIVIVFFCGYYCYPSLNGMRVLLSIICTVSLKIFAIRN